VPEPKPITTARRVNCQQIAKMSSGTVESPLKSDVHELLRVEDQLRVDDDMLKPKLPGRRSNRNRVIHNTPGRHSRSKYDDDLHNRGVTFRRQSRDASSHQAELRRIKTVV